MYMVYAVVVRTSSSADSFIYLFIYLFIIIKYIYVS